MPPKRQKLDKPESRTTGIMQFFSKQQENHQLPVPMTPKASIETTCSDEDDDDSFEVIFEKCTPGPSTSTPKSHKTPVSKTPETPKTATKWGNVLQKNSLASGESTGRDWQNPISMQVGKSRKSAEKNVKSDLLTYGFDETLGNTIFYPIDEPIRPFELNLIKSVSASNCCLALPASSPSTPARICAISVANFLKWFPRCRVLLVSSSEEWFYSLEQLGLDAQVTKIQTMAQFKKPKNGLGRILLCANPQCAVKVVESSEAKEFLEDIRLVLIDMKTADCCTKYNPILNALTMRETFFRCVVLTTATSNTSRRTASITKRQQMITNLQLSDWVEPPETDFSFRSSNIPSGVEVKYWKSSENSEKLAEIIKKFERFSEKLMEEMAEEGVIPSKSIRQCIWIDWKNTKTNPSMISDKVQIAELLITCYKYLVIDGIAAARSYVNQCASTTEFQKYTNEIMGIFGGFFEFSAKYQLLVTAIEKFLKSDNHVRGVILCRDTEQATEIQNFLELNLPKTVNCMRIIPTGQPSARNLWQISRISNVFADGKSPKILVIPVKIPEFIGFSDCIPFAELTFIASVSRDSVFNFRKFHGAHLMILNDPLEKLRKEDGRLIVDDGKFAQKDSKSVKQGAVERYDFKYESSRLRLNPANLFLKFFYPRKMGRLFSEEPADFQLATTSVEGSSKEPAAETSRRVNNSDSSKVSRKKRTLIRVKETTDPDAKRPHQVEELAEDKTMWDDDVQILGDTKSSKSAQKIAKNPRGTYEWTINKNRRRYEYINEISDEKRIRRLDELIRNLDAQFEI